MATKNVNGVDVELTPEELSELETRRAAAAAKKAEYASLKYQRDRAAAYPPIEDYIDGVVKGDQDQIDAYIAACLAVKDQYPKP